jgi:hypothetical protein
MEHFWYKFPRTLSIHVYTYDMIYTNTQAFTTEYPWLLDLEIQDQDNKAGCKQPRKVKQDEAKKIKKHTRK